MGMGVGSSAVNNPVSTADSFLRSADVHIHLEWRVV